MANSPDSWRITPEERVKHDGQFASLNPVQGFISGDQAKSFLIKSGLPPAVLGHIWGLADMTADGKMDQKEFSIAVFLIQKKLQGFDLPRALPQGLKMDPGRGVPSGGGFFMPQGSPSVPSHYAPPPGPPPTSAAPYGPPPGPPPQSSPYSSVPGSPSPYATAPAAPPPSSHYAPVPGAQPAAAFNSPNSRARSSSVTAEWTVPQQNRLKYNQVFNQNDRTRRGYLLGIEAKGILMQSGLPHQMLAQIWTMSDIDNDGKLTSEEFCVAMHLVEMAKAGQPLPQALPQELIPPSYRRERKLSVTGQQSAPNVTIQAAKTDAFGDLIGGFGAPPTASPPEVPEREEIEEKSEPIKPAVTFEDKRRMNFEKGQAELEKRRAQLREQQQKDEEARLAAERAEFEKQERIRLEQERKRQMEFERQMERQRQMEQEREEQRRKALEQREAARRELERQRQVEWERQRIEQLTAEKNRELEQVLILKSQTSTMRNELETFDNKKLDLTNRISQARDGIADITNGIQMMRQSRDIKLGDIDRLQNEIQTYHGKLLKLNQEKDLLNETSQTIAQSNPISDSYKTVAHSHGNKELSVQKLKVQLEQIEKDTSSKLAEIDKYNVQLKDNNSSIAKLESDISKLRQLLENKRREQATSAATSVGAGGSDAKKDPWLDSFNTTDMFGSSGAQPTSTAQGLFGTTTTTTTDSNKDSWANFFTSDSVQTSGFDTAPTDTISTGFFDNQPANSTAISADAFGTSNIDSSPGITKYRAVFPFEARNSDELSFNIGDIILVGTDQSGAEPGWLGGQFNGQRGWFPQAYVEKVEDSAVDDEQIYDIPSLTKEAEPATSVASTDFFSSESPQKPAETTVSSLPQSDSSSFTVVASTTNTSTSSPVPGQGPTAPEGLQAQALYPWRAKKENHLTFNKGDIITVREQQDMWWSGELDGKIGWYPKSYVKLIGSVPIGTSTSVTKTTESRSETPLSVVGSSSPVHAMDSPVTDTKDKFYVAMFPYNSTESGDLAFQQGEIIKVTKMDGDWWTGSIGDKSGMFPGNYVKKSEVQSTPTSTPVSLTGKQGKKPEIASVIAAYTATGDEQLSLSPGQLIQIRKKNPTGWWEGELQARGQKKKVGWFPANYVKVLGSGSARSTPVSGTSASPIPSSLQTSQTSFSSAPSPLPPSGPAPTEIPQGRASAQAIEQVAALYPYQSQNSDELTFHKGSVINVINKDDPDWWKGEINGTTGVFPANYVQPLSDS